MSVVESLQADAAKLLADGRVKMVIASRRRNGDCVPAFFTDPAQTDALDYDPDQKLNPAAYLRKEEIRRQMPVAVVARPAAIRSILVLAAESQVTDDDVVILGVDADTCHGPLDLAAGAKLLNENFPDLAPDPDTLAKVAELSEMSPEQRSAFWAQQFNKCTRCYACRAVCPGCYCRKCIVERNTPQWISTAALGHGNYAWNVIRAFHLAGRCTACGACEAACPQGIPLMLLNAHLGLTVEAEFDVKVGYDPQAEPVIGGWCEDDKEEYIR